MYLDYFLLNNILGIVLNLYLISELFVCVFWGYVCKKCMRDFVGGFYEGFENILYEFSGKFLIIGMSENIWLWELI